MRSTQTRRTSRSWCRASAPSPTVGSERRRRTRWKRSPKRRAAAFTARRSTRRLPKRTLPALTLTRRSTRNLYPSWTARSGRRAGTRRRTGRPIRVSLRKSKAKATTSASRGSCARRLTRPIKTRRARHTQATSRWSRRSRRREMPNSRSSLPERRSSPEFLKASLAR